MATFGTLFSLLFSLHLHNPSVVHGQVCEASWYNRPQCYRPIAKEFCDTTIERCPRCRKQVNATTTFCRVKKSSDTGKSCPDGFITCSFSESSVTKPPPPETTQASSQSFDDRTTLPVVFPRFPEATDAGNVPPSITSTSSMSTAARSHDEPLAKHSIQDDDSKSKGISPTMFDEEPLNQESGQRSSVEKVDGKESWTIHTAAIVGGGIVIVLLYIVYDQYLRRGIHVNNREEEEQDEESSSNISYVLSSASMNQEMPPPRE
jgi:hypothetical protein